MLSKIVDVRRSIMKIWWKTKEIIDKIPFFMNHPAFKRRYMVVRPLFSLLLKLRSNSTGSFGEASRMRFTGKVVWPISKADFFPFFLGKDPTLSLSRFKIRFSGENWFCAENGKNILDNKNYLAVDTGARNFWTFHYC